MFDREAEVDAFEFDRVAGLIVEDDPVAVFVFVIEVDFDTGGADEEIVDQGGILAVEAEFVASVVGFGASGEDFDNQAALLTTDDGLLSKISEPTLESLPLQRLEFQTIELNDRGKVIAQPHKTAQCFDEILDESGLLLRMIVILGGSFRMGSPQDELNSYNDEKPQHLVTVPSFAIGQLTITQAQWRAIAALPKVKRRLNPSPSYYSGDDRPVERVNWEEAIEFCDRLAGLTRKPYCLPTEAEWEYACRAGTTTPFYCGQTITTDVANYRGLDDDRGEQGVFLGNYGKGPKGKYRGATIDAHEFAPNPFGLHNMHGNVWEWCMDQWHSGYDNPPVDGSAWIDQDADVNSDRVIRGGSWSISPQNCRSAIRFFYAPDLRYSILGFRVICRLRPQHSSIVSIGRWES